MGNNQSREAENSGERTEDCLHFFGLALLDERVEDHDVLALHTSTVGSAIWFHDPTRHQTHPRQAKEVRIRVRRPLRAVDLVQVLERELEPRCERLDAGAQVTLR